MNRDPRTIKETTIEECPCCLQHSLAIYENSKECEECGYCYNNPYIGEESPTVKITVESHIDNWEAEMQRRIWNAITVAKRLHVLKKRTKEAWSIEELILMLVKNNIRDIEEAADIKLKHFPVRSE
jgi:hypothetical protein